MRMSEGVPLTDLDRWRTALAEFRELGLLEERGGRAVLTRRGRLMADAVAEVFVESGADFQSANPTNAD
jgi:oxygen-independent coproporphyrinogen-3 oxidase